MNLKKMERYLRVNLLRPGPRHMKKEFTGPRSHKGWETLHYATSCKHSLVLLRVGEIIARNMLSWLKSLTL